VFNYGAGIEISDHFLNFCIWRKTPALQLKNLAARGKLIKIRASHKLFEACKKEKSAQTKIKTTSEMVEACSLSRFLDLSLEDSSEPSLMSEEESQPIIEYESKGEEESQLFNGKAKTNPFDLLIAATGASIFVVSLLFRMSKLWFWPKKGKPHECLVHTILCDWGNQPNATRSLPDEALHLLPLLLLRPSYHLLQNPISPFSFLLHSHLHKEILT
ncbi:hypothetical protein DVH24_036115, partial [Malus domestica]